MRGDTSKKIRKFVRNKIGEEPVILDTVKIEESARQIEAYLFNNGYFNREVTYTVIPKKNKSQKATIQYNVQTNAKYRIKTITYGIDDKRLYFKVFDDAKNSKLKEGGFFSAEIIAEERERITKKLREDGYYFFNKEYIVFSVDSAIAGNYVNIDLQIRNPDLFTPHQRYSINNVYVNVVNPADVDSPDTRINWHTTDGVWINLNEYKINEEILLRRILIEPQATFNQEKVDNTYNSLNDVQLFRQTSISFDKDTIEGKLNCYINLVPDKRHEYLLEPQLITSDQNNAVEQNNLRNYGLANAVTYRNRNLFGSAETFELRYRISLEGQVRNNDSLQFLSNIEHNVTGTLGLPRVTVLKPFQKRWELRNTRSALVGNFIYESNIDFSRRVLSLGYSELFASSNLLHNFNVSLFEVSFNKTNAKRDFLSLVNPADSVFIANLFTTNLITNTRITWVYSDKILSPTGSHFFSRVMLESAGWGLTRFMKGASVPLPADGIYKIDNVNFEQFVKLDIDIRYTQVLNEYNTFAYRLHTGVGRAYGNSTTMPFVRRYFIGGANSLRGWRPRTVGPGNYTNNDPGVRADRSGELIIEAQTEYRFSIIHNLLEGALFIDAGNIWYTRPIAGRQGVEFNPQTFLNQMALNSGVGLRFDFSFFVLRFDFGVPLRNPELPSKERWLLDDYSNGSRKFFPSLVLNLGLGYPF